MGLHLFLLEITALKILTLKCLKFKDLPAYQGLYTVPISMLVYLIFGTATHVALGIFAAVTILIKKETDKFDGVLFSTKGLHSFGFISNNPVMARVYISACLAFMAGIFQVIF
jgi:MFS superfamily sulfate permease-like transporter